MDVSGRTSTPGPCTPPIQTRPARSQRPRGRRHHRPVEGRLRCWDDHPSRTRRTVESYLTHTHPFRGPDCPPHSPLGRPVLEPTSLSSHPLSSTTLAPPTSHLHIGKCPSGPRGIMRTQTAALVAFLLSRALSPGILLVSFLTKRGPSLGPSVSRPWGPPPSSGAQEYGCQRAHRYSSLISRAFWATCRATLSSPSDWLVLFQLSPIMSQVLDSPPPPPLHVSRLSARNQVSNPRTGAERRPRGNCLSNGTWSRLSKDRTRSFNTPVTDDSPYRATPAESGLAWGASIRRLSRRLSVHLPTTHMTCRGHMSEEQPGLTGLRRSAVFKSIGHLTSWPRYHGLFFTQTAFLATSSPKARRLQIQV